MQSGGRSKRYLPSDSKIEYSNGDALRRSNKSSDSQKSNNQKDKSPQIPKQYDMEVSSDSESILERKPKPPVFESQDSYALSTQGSEHENAEDESEENINKVDDSNYLSVSSISEAFNESISASKKNEESIEEEIQKPIEIKDTKAATSRKRRQPHRLPDDARLYKKFSKTTMQYKNDRPKSVPKQSPPKPPANNNNFETPRVNRRASPLKVQLKPIPDELLQLHQNNSVKKEVPKQNPKISPAKTNSPQIQNKKPANTDNKPTNPTQISNNNKIPNNPSPKPVPKESQIPVKSPRHNSPQKVPNSPSKIPTQNRTKSPVKQPPKSLQNKSPSKTPQNKENPKSQNNEIQKSNSDIPKKQNEDSLISSPPTPTEIPQIRKRKKSISPIVLPQHISSPPKCDYKNLSPEYLQLLAQKELLQREISNLEIQNSEFATMTNEEITIVTRFQGIVFEQVNSYLFSVTTAVNEHNQRIKKEIEDLRTINDELTRISSEKSFMTVKFSNDRIRRDMRSILNSSKKAQKDIENLNSISTVLTSKKSIKAEAEDLTNEMLALQTEIDSMKARNEQLSIEEKPETEDLSFLENSLEKYQENLQNLPKSDTVFPITQEILYQREEFDEKMMIMESMADIQKSFYNVTNDEEKENLKEEYNNLLSKLNGQTDSSLYNSLKFESKRFKDNFSQQQILTKTGNLLEQKLLENQLILDDLVLDLQKSDMKSDTNELVEEIVEDLKQKYSLKNIVTYLERNFPETKEKSTPLEKVKLARQIVQNGNAARKQLL
ncbi:hypothetical protein TVAG_488950 [Trichomonas vaginalis G3]|uniref:Uncharacterized protein n=1 Tax=Trichomonas vaginalis (strain ATCC PRA-98 / G3) TaxID=412133 RepID=A2FL67_TRIV3|nr:hypothetical protein TVAGG3_0426900 [Trichomonas vaginalis G3]EAX94356.1 hypothetical protein TVAG_488950 [Trichomonas vaginalis G3]KAI5536481.1 hypothetical protein TVAGG3_0426900 [Trichomonas vaginalis G3]|eukprot:XP_001307286.1 hypothetical protein [Trichomonas vaginalis G3]